MFNAGKYEGLLIMRLLDIFIQADLQNLDSCYLIDPYYSKKHCRWKLAYYQHKTGNLNPCRTK
jgi:hypothetical protein